MKCLNELDFGNGVTFAFKLGYNNGYSGSRYLNLMYAAPYTCMISGTIQHELLHVLGRSACSMKLIGLI